MRKNIEGRRRYQTLLELLSNGHSIVSCSALMKRSRQTIHTMLRELRLMNKCHNTLELIAKYNMGKRIRFEETADEKN